MKRFFSVIVALLVLLMQGCGAKQNTTEQTTDAVEEIEAVIYPEAKSIVHLQMREPDTLDPILTTRQSVRDAMLTVYEPLFNVNANFGLENVLAETYVFNETATIMTLKIKEGILWHNGHPFMADDVVYTVNKIKQNPQSSYYLNLESVDRVEKQNDYEVVFYLTEPNVNLVYSLYFPIMFRNETGDLAVVGTGPFMLEKAEKQSLSLVKNTSWHGGEVLSDGVEFMYMRTAKMAQEAFSSGKIHAVTEAMLDTENYAIKSSQKKYTYPDGIFEFVGFNAQRGIFGDSLIRSAAANAINRNSLGITEDAAVASGFPMMHGSEAFSPSYELSTYSLDYAKELIFSAGWVDTDGDSVPEKTFNGETERLEMSLLVADRDPERIKIAEAIKEQLTLAGFEVTVEIVDIETYNMRVAGGQYDAYLGALYYDAPYDIADLLETAGNVNYQGYSSVEMDNALLHFASATSYDKQSVAFHEIQTIYMAHQPVTGLVFRTTFVVTNSVISGEIAPYPYSPYANIASWIVN